MSKCIVSAILLFVFATSVLAQSIVVNTTDLKQTITMMGGDMERSSFAVQSAANTNDIIQWGFGDIAFNTCRVQYDKNQELVEGTKNWSFYAKQVATMKQIKAINPNIQFFGTMRSDYSGYNGENNMPDWIVNYSTKVVDTNKYGVFLADYVEYMSQQGVPIAVMSVAKEWTSYVPADKADDIILKLKSELASRGVDMPLISDQGFWSLSQGLTYMKKVASLGTKSLYSSFSTHDYSSSETETYSSVIAYANTLGIPVVHDEFSTGSGAATSGVEPAMSKPIGVYIDKATAYAAGLAGEVFFEIWSRGINTETRSIYYPSGGTGTRLRGYYIMKEFANNSLNYNYINTTITSLSKVYSISFRKGNKVVLWVINKNTIDYPVVPISVSANKIVGPVNVHYWTNNTSAEGATATLSANGNMFEQGVAAESMSCYTFEVQDTGDNLALNGVATQSSTESAAAASRAIDGNTDGAMANATFSQTTTETNPWWQVDLGANDTIASVEVYNITDACCKDGLVNFKLSVLDANNTVVFTQTQTTAPNPMVNISVGNVIGKVIKIELTGTASLALAEVKVIKGSIFSKADQTITFPELPTVTYSLDAISPGATVSSGLGVEYTSSNTSVATIVNRQIKLVGVGSSTITAIRAASLNYNAAANVSRTLTVIKADQQITFPALTAVKVGDPSFVLSATASSGLDVSYTSSNANVATIESGRVLIVGVGNTTITATQSGNDKYNAAANVTQSLTVEASDVVDDPNQVVLSPKADAYVRGGSYASTNYGSELDLLIKETTSLDFERKAYLQFDLYDLTVVEKAVLRMYSTSSSAGQIMVYKTTDNWLENTITYSNAPAAGTSISSLAVASSGVYYEWDVTDYIKEQMAGDDFASFMLGDISTTKNSLGFTSKEAAANRPELVITKSLSNALIQTKDNNKASFLLYPNPMKNTLTIANTEIVLLEIYNNEGKQVLNMTKTPSDKTIDVSHLTKGIYLVRGFNEQGQTMTQKVVKE